MKRTSVVSSQIKSIGYQPEGRILEIEFNRGGVYQYTPILENIHRDLMAAESIGKFFSTHIKGNPTITWKKISDNHKN